MKSGLDKAEKSSRNCKIMDFQNTTLNDIELVFEIYEAAVEFQKARSHRAWLAFNREFIETEITENRNRKIMLDGEIACVFSLSFSDPLIWDEEKNESAVFLHRVAVNPKFRHIKFFPLIIQWLKGHAKNNGKKYIRMDTWNDNQKLIDYYIRCGFDNVGTTAPKNAAEMPKHYEGILLRLFELKIDYENK